MKKILLVTAAAAAMVAAAAPAAAQTNQRHYAGTAPIVGPYTATNPSNVPNLQVGPFIIIPSDLVLAEGATAAGFGTRYTASTTAPANTTPLTPTVNVVFSLTGVVERDCSFYSGNNAAARNIDFGVIGVRTGNNENVSNAFDMAGPATAAIETLTAGCNFNNEVIIAKTNAAQGMVNSNPGGYDTDEFQANIPYSVTATWAGVGVGVVGTGGNETLTASTTQPGATRQQGAWRSEMDININAPVAAKGLVAGTYTDTMTLTLRAL